MKRVIVTGANGFIGRHLCRTLADAGIEVTACIRERSDASALEEISGSMRLCRVPSLSSDIDVSQVLQDADVVIHLAGRAHVMRETERDPLSEFRRVNVAATETIALLALKAGVRRFIYLSSIKVNGEATEGCAYLADGQPMYSDPYGQSKWEAEERLRLIATGTHMEWVVVRPPLVYGPGVRGNFLSLMKCAYRRLPLPVGSVHNMRSLVSVYNLCDLLYLVLEHPRAANNRFLVSDPEDISTPDLVRHIAAALHRSPRVIRFPEKVLFMAGTLFRREAAIRRICSSLVMDREKTRKTLAWRPPMTLDQSLEATAEWFLNWIARQ